MSGTEMTGYNGGHASMTLNRLAAQTEHELELAVRTVPCPSCDTGPGELCEIGFRAHTSRYLRAAEHGLVPPLPGVGRG